jgi:hypothetical protein
MSATDLRLLIDHNVGRGVALALREAGYDAVFAGDVDPHLSDAVILGWAVREDRHAWITIQVLFGLVPGLNSRRL